MKKRIYLTAFILGALVCAGIVFWAAPALAQTLSLGINQAGQGTGLGSGDIRVIIGRIIQVALGLVGVVLLVYIIYAGFLWMTSGGNEEKVADAKKILRNAIIGLVIILAAFSIAQFIITSLIGATTGEGGGGVNLGQFASFDTGSLGEGIIQAVYPPPGATDIPRNTEIIVTFKVKMGHDSIIGADGKINAANIKIIKTADIASGGVAQTDASKFLTDVSGNTNDDKTYVFIPSQYLGSPTDKISYTVFFTGGSNGIKRADGTAGFDGSWSQGYHWEFETSTTIDITPPQVVSYFPQDMKVNPHPADRNTLIQINFNEAVDPVGAAGDVPPLSNIKIVDQNGKPVEGNWEIGNEYRTIEFRSNVLGGQNSCGNDIYVLPANSTLTVTALAATISTDPLVTALAPAHANLPYPYDGITDVCANSLDGNRNGKGEGPPTDNVTWSFTTSDKIDITPPTITSTDPAAETGSVSTTAPVNLNFSKPMSITTLDNRYMLFYGWADTDPRTQVPFWYFGEGDNISAVTGQPVTSPDDPIGYTRGEIVHQALAPTVGACDSGARKNEACKVDSDCGTGTCVLTRFDYYPDATSGITDMNQNCFFPACGQDTSRPYCCPNATQENTCSVACEMDNYGGLYCPN
jgi:Type IV secretion system pilin/Bacterial Ig-like domain